MTDGKFTEEDAKNDGKIKAEIKGKLKGVAKRESPEIYEYYEQEAERLGIDPGVLLADDLVKVLNDEGFANRILDTEISLKEAKMDEIRKSDVEFAQEIQEMVGDDDEGGEEDIIENLVVERLKQATESPIGRATQGLSQEAGGNNELAQEVRKLRQEVRDGGGSQTSEEGSSEAGTEQRKSSKEREEEIDGLFADGQDEETVEDDEPEVVEVTAEEVDEDRKEEGEAEEDSDEMEGDVEAEQETSNTDEEVDRDTEPQSEWGDGGEVDDWGAMGGGNGPMTADPEEEQ